jgi:hypothetical protein
MESFGDCSFVTELVEMLLLSVKEILAAPSISQFPEV